MPVRVKKTRKNKKLEPRSDSIGAGKALAIRAKFVWMQLGVCDQAAAAKARAAGLTVIMNR